LLKGAETEGSGAAVAVAPFREVLVEVKLRDDTDRPR
jgi:hypothetical protein